MDITRSVPSVFMCRLTGITGPNHGLLGYYLNQGSTWTLFDEFLRKSATIRTLDLLQII